MPTVIDISHYQPEVDFAAAKAGGLKAVIIKCTEGTGIFDDKFLSHVEAADEAGVAWCSYHFLRHGNAEAQMGFYLSKLSPRAGERVCIDYEDNACTLDDLHEAVNALLAFSDSDDLDLQITVYSGHLIKDQLGSKTDTLLAQRTSLWLAQYTTGTPTWPKGTWPMWSLWQYSDSEKIAGYNGPVDGDRFNGPDDALLKWIGPATQQPPQPAPDEDVPNVTVTLASDKPVSVTVAAGANVTLL